MEGWECWEWLLSFVWLESWECWERSNFELARKGGIPCKFLNLPLLNLIECQSPPHQHPL